MRIEVWSDIACPWCYVGKRRLERALEGFEYEGEVVVVYRSFQLDPGAPPEREGDYLRLLARKYGRSEPEARAMLERMTEIAAAEGLEYRFDLIRPGSTLDGHRLLQLALTFGHQDEMKERLMRAYLCEGELISDHRTLRRLASDAGLPGDRVDEVLGSREFAERVDDDLDLGMSFALTGVPYYLIDRRAFFAGAQPAETMVALLERARDQVDGSGEAPAGATA
jgi:predicted DsbA family dithiol-disulfide isomerase